MRRGDRGTQPKGILAGWGVDLRDPTADKRLVEYCLSIPTEQYVATAFSVPWPGAPWPTGCRRLFSANAEEDIRRPIGMKD